MCSLSQGSDFHTISIIVDCQGGICEDKHTFSVAIEGLKNRYSTSRGVSLPFKEVFVETFD